MKHKKPKLYVSLPENSIELAQAALHSGADGVKVHLNAYHRASGTTFGSYGQEESFLKTFAKLECEKFVMVGQETLPTLQEMHLLKNLGFSGFNVYFSHAKPHLFESGMRPILALAHGFTDSDIDSVCTVSQAWIEASVLDFNDYGKPLTQGDLETYGKIVTRSQRPVIVPSQKKIVPDDLHALTSTGIYAVLLGIISIGQTPESISLSVGQFRDTLHEISTSST